MQILEIRLGLFYFVYYPNVNCNYNISLICHFFMTLWDKPLKLPESDDSDNLKHVSYIYIYYFCIREIIIGIREITIRTNPVIEYFE